MIADDHPMMREGIASIIARTSDIEVVGQAEDGLKAIELFRRLKPDITLMDIQMPSVGGVDAIAKIRGEFPLAKIIVLTTYAGDVQAQRALKAGAAGYLLKTAVGKDLLDTIRSVFAGRRFIPAEIAQQMALHAGDDPLTVRELEVLRLLSDGQSNKEVGRSLGLSEDTIKGHVKGLFAKLNVRDRTEATMVAIKRGILEPPLAQDGSSQRNKSDK
jgi:DNA-binding NarL/FixJ family response regulator